MEECCNTNPPKMHNKRKVRTCTRGVYIGLRKGPLPVAGAGYSAKIGSKDSIAPF